MWKKNIFFLTASAHSAPFGKYDYRDNFARIVFSASSAPDIEIGRHSIRGIFVASSFVAGIFILGGKFKIAVVYEAAIIDR